MESENKKAATGWDRTSDLSVNSRALYRLSYGSYGDNLCHIYHLIPCTTVYLDVFSLNSSLIAGRLTQKDINLSKEFIRY